MTSIVSLSGFPGLSPERQGRATRMLSGCSDLDLGCSALKATGGGGGDRGTSLYSAATATAGRHMRLTSRHVTSRLPTPMPEFDSFIGDIGKGAQSSSSLSFKIPQSPTSTLESPPPPPALQPKCLSTPLVPEVRTPPAKAKLEAKNEAEYKAGVALAERLVVVGGFATGSFQVEVVVGRDPSAGHTYGLRVTDKAH